jgi:hypothetical protein
LTVALVRGASRTWNAVVVGHASAISTHRMARAAATAPATRRGGAHGDPLALPQRGAALDIGDQEGDGAGRQLRHPRLSN